MKKLSVLEIWWDAVEKDLGTRRLAIALLLLAVIGAFGIAAACEIGIRVFNTNWHSDFGYTVQRNREVGAFFIVWGGATLAPVAQGLVGAALLSVYSTAPRSNMRLRAIAVAIVGSIPLYIAGLTLVVLPGVMLFAIAFVISCGWWASGSRRLLGLNYGQAPELVAVSLTISGGVLLLLSAAVPL